MEWLEQLKQHRLYRQHLLSFKDLSSPTEEPVSPVSPNGDGKDIDKELSLVEKDLSHLQNILDSIQQPNSKDKKDDEGKQRDFLVLAKEGKTSGSLRTRKLLKVEIFEHARFSSQLWLAFTTSGECSETWEIIYF
jgi:hypothetical protein